ncbi:MAG: MBL fold metallo-hydrolase [Fidelibacterota bacterium]|nr:MAG: MBL fold metallo-hydrolase [Candidatus Neomarinimicrobiota bacterium]
MTSIYRLGMALFLLSCASTKINHQSTPINNTIYSGPDEVETVYHLQPGSIDGCYLVKYDASFILIDTGVYSKRTELSGALSDIGCTPDNLKLIIITHGHYDHTGNAAYLQKSFNAEILMHKNDVVMVESGIVPTKTRKFRPLYVRMIAPLFLLFYRSTINDQENNFEIFQPDIIVDDESFDLRPHGFNAIALHIPGHSDGSIAILTEANNLFSGDILVNFNNKPTFNSNMADISFDDLDSSIAKIKEMPINYVFPGHGKPFSMDRLSR